MPVRQARALATTLWGFLRRFETRALLIFMAAIGAVWAFFSIAEEVAEGETHAVDERLILLFRNPADLNDPIGPRNVEEAVRDITALGGFTVVTLATIVGVLAFAFHRRWRHAAVLLGTVLLAEFSSETTKALYSRPRPDIVPHGAYVYSGSFPSGHSTLSAATFLTLAVLISSLEPHRRTKALVYVLALALLVTIGVSRVYLGVHWPSDVLAGWCLGAAWAFLAWVVLRAVGGRTRG
ncbi:phosphatase PAP2 family protein [Phenylobacterium sp. VNQ135]|uniref:phosphatase PAP2 family protein n=1 Tax=Phenylobacterium sp. VNQ135 TaxID=3400922 RepID=UPI003C099946